MPDEKSVTQQLHDLLTGRLGGTFRQYIKPEIRADVFYRLVYLAERGIESLRQEWKAKPEGASAGKAASLASWQIDLEMLPGKVEEALTKQAKKAKKRKAK